ncbi:MAG: murein biosynthesis integral membrane protein MurJ [Verrucomicrobiota bacterium]|nr:murein biosynthesis integral membrane protein MurJ [Verrucomicrobiota bacterium]
MSKFAKSLSTVSSLTMLSRIMGLFRDVLFFSFFGATIFGEAFILEFTIPNLFRRMLGEGSLTSAFVPIFVETKDKGGLGKAFGLLNQVLSRLFTGLASLTVVVVVLSLVVCNQEFLTSDKWSLGLSLNALSFGYVVFICSSAIVVGALNTQGKFFAGAFSPIILNTVLILVLLIGGSVLQMEMLDLAILLCSGVLFSGFLQLLMPAFQMRKLEGWQFRMDFSNSEEFGRIKALFWIGALGAAVAQVNTLVSRFLAYSLDETGGLTYLFMSSRLIELPLGVFAIAISTVLFPQLAKAASGADKDALKTRFFDGLRITWAITLPSAVGLAILADPILSVLFEWGNFGDKNIASARPILVITSLALPLYAVSAFIVKTFHAKKNMKFPLHAAILSLLSNTFLSLWLMRDYGVEGLAWANVCAAFIQTSYLMLRTAELGKVHLLGVKPLYFMHCVIACFFMGIVIFWLSSSLEPEGKWMELISLILLVGTGCVIYFLSAFALGIPEFRICLPIILKYLRFGTKKR